MKALFQKYFELSAWVIALSLLAFMDPQSNTHYSLCPFKFIGISFCPGCGIGHSISYLFHGDLRASFSAHPLGIFALAVILLRIFRLSRYHLSYHFKINCYGQ
ncbi:MAG TPA: DUF2752 domain-containing protein [Hanamia sp.]